MKRKPDQKRRNALAMLMYRLVFDRFHIDHDVHTTTAMFDFRRQWSALLYNELQSTHVNVNRCVRFV